MVWAADAGPRPGAAGRWSAFRRERAGRRYGPVPSGEPRNRNGVRLHALPVDDLVAVTWQRLGHTCILVGSVSRDELFTLASWRGDGTLRY